MEKYGVTISIAAGIMGILFRYAYKHPDAYLKRMPLLYGVATALYACVICWSSGVSTTYIRLKPFIAANKLDAATQTIESMKPNGEFSFAIYGVFVIYLTMLCYLHKILAIRDDSDTA